MKLLLLWLLGVPAAVGAMVTLRPPVSGPADGVVAPQAKSLRSAGACLPFSEAAPGPRAGCRPPAG